MLNNMNQYGGRPGENINDPLIIIPPPPGWRNPVGRPCYGSGCRNRYDHDRFDHDRHDRHDHDRFDRHDHDRFDRRDYDRFDRRDYDRRRRSPWY